MIEQILKDLTQRPCHLELEDKDWFALSAFFNSANETDRGRLAKAVASWSGVSEMHIVVHALCNLSSETLSTEQCQLLLKELQTHQHQATLDIIRFQQRDFLRRLDLSLLEMTRTEWLVMLNRFEQHKRHAITSLFFFGTLSSIRRVKYDDLIDLVRTLPPSRHVKRKRQTETLPSKRMYQSFQEDDGINPLITEKTDDPILQRAIEATGVRTTSLTPVTPERSHLCVARTPGGTKVRRLWEWNSVTFYQNLSPYGKKSGEGRVDVRGVSQSRIEETLPVLEFQRAEPVEFTATLELIKSQMGIRRRGTIKTKASDVFRAHGIEIIPAHGRSHHWAHLIAHFLGDISDISSQDSDNEVINLVPSTAAANYNTLEAIELFIRKKLINESTEQISIKVTPKYSGESLIPDLLIYKLNWSENNAMEDQQNCSETFYINPQSYQRITKSMHETIATLRKHRDTALSSSQINDENRPNFGQQ